MALARRGNSSEIAEKVKEARGQREEALASSTETKRKLIPTGSTILNLALSDTIDGGYVPGSIVNIVGDSSAGKTFLLWTMFAEVLWKDDFKDYIVHYDEPEQAFYMNIAKLFRLRNSIDEVTDANTMLPVVKVDIVSKTIQDFFVNVVKALKDNTPIIYGLDSVDALTSNEELERVAKLVKTGDEGGSYKTEIARMLSEFFRVNEEAIKSTKSLLAMISQTRDNIGVMFGDKKTRSGGNALRFYSTHEIWMHVKGHEKRFDREVGVNVRVKVKKNKLTGKINREVEFPIYYDYGIDDTGSCIDFLLAEKEWNTTQTGVIINPFKEGRRDTLISYIEHEGLVWDLRKTVGHVWAELEEKIRTDREPKYGK